MARVIETVAGLAVMLQACAAPEFPVVQRPSTVVVGVSPPLGRQALDSIYWYTGFRPDSLVIAAGVLRLAMPAGSVGQELESSRAGCSSPAIPFGVVQRVAREGWRNAGQRAGADTVIVTVGQLLVERRTWAGRTSCGAGPAMMRIGPDELRGAS